jgi:PIN domain nuclease of toxin-antitoxin system
MTSYILDACALLALLKEEEGAYAVDNLFQKAVRGEAALYMSIINLLEVFYGFIRESGLDREEEIMRCIDDTPLRILNYISQPVYREAARLKGTYHRISLADAVGLATAFELSGQFVTSDHHELEKIEQNEPYTLFWVR